MRVLLLLLALSPASAQTAGIPLVPVDARPNVVDARPDVVTTYDSISGPLNNPLFHGVRSVYGGEMTLQADEISGDLRGQKFGAQGNVRVHEADTSLEAATLDFNGAKQTGQATQAVVARRPYTIRAEKIILTPTEVQADNADFTTAPPDVSPDYHIRIGTATLSKKTRRVAVKNATLYLFHTRLFTIKQYSFHLPQPGAAPRRQGLLPQFGYSGRYGAFVGYAGDTQAAVPARYSLILSTRRSVQARITAAQVLSRQAPPFAPAVRPLAPNDYLGAIRALATINPGPVPDGDPLRFHDFLPDLNPIRLYDAPPLGLLQSDEELSYHLEASGRRRDDLYVSRMPELSLFGRLPLTPVPALPTATSASGFRDFLRRPVVYAEGQAQTGYYQEQPTGIGGSRNRFQAALMTRPLLVSANTVFLPRLVYVVNQYPGRSQTYNYAQASFAVNHYFSDRRAVGLQYLGSTVHGDSPFNFDVLDTTQELDARVQTGDHRLALAGLVRFDLRRHNVIDYKLAVAPSLRGLIPVFSYNFRSRSIGVGVEIEGLTF